MRLVYSAEALADLVRLRAFIAEKDPSAATRIGLELVARIENLDVLLTGLGSPENEGHASELVVRDHVGELLQALICSEQRLRRDVELRRELFDLLPLNGE